MNLQDIVKERIMAEIIYDRDTMILQLAKEIEELKAENKVLKEKKEEDK